MKHQQWYGAVHKECIKREAKLTADLATAQARVKELEETLKWIKLCLLKENVPETNRVADAFNKAAAALGDVAKDDNDEHPPCAGCGEPSVGKIGLTPTCQQCYDNYQAGHEEMKRLMKEDSDEQAECE